MPHSCTAACTAGWQPGRKCHCRSCGGNFSTVGNFDKHLERTEKAVRCLTPSEAGLEPNKHGVLIQPGEVDIRERFEKRSA